MPSPLSSSQLENLWLQNTDYKGLYKEPRLTDEIHVICEIYSPGTAPREVPGEYFTYPLRFPKAKSMRGEQMRGE